MPEMPEVEARRRAIEQAFIGSRLTSLNIYKKGIIKHADAPMQRNVIGKTLRSVDRRGKYLIFEFLDALKMTFHFGLFGEMEIGGTEDEFSSVCVRLAFDNKRALFLLKWASIWFGMGIEELEKLGPDPLAEPEKFMLQYLINALAKRKTKIKPFLMDQSIIAGIGAVYADEILFQSGILPTRSANDLSGKEASRLYDAIIKTLKTAVKKTVALGREDRPFLSLENRQSCPVCGTQIVNTRLAGRRTLYCPSCQH
jgi:formamidopyrimidine-DNA glycosylase